MNDSRYWAGSVDMNYQTALVSSFSPNFYKFLDLLFVSDFWLGLAKNGYRYVSQSLTHFVGTINHHHACNA